MDQKTLRLELLKLTYTHGRPAAEAVARARELEDFIGVETVAGKKPPLHLRKNK